MQNNLIREEVPLSGVAADSILQRYDAALPDNWFLAFRENLVASKRRELIT
jgi:hypothetical protein